jgi:hypothetical protein
MELRPERLPEKIEIAQGTLTERLSDPQQPDLDEQSALRDALHALRVFFPLLRRHRGRGAVTRPNESSTA